jgi:hypothetical protein
MNLVARDSCLVHASSVKRMGSGMMLQFIVSLAVIVITIVMIPIGIVFYSM